MSQKNTSLLVIEVKNLFRTFAQNLAGDWNYKKIYFKKKKKKKKNSTTTVIKSILFNAQSISKSMR